MAIEKKYSHDKLVLLLVSLNVFLALLETVIILLKLGNISPNFHIVQYRSDLGLGAFKNGSTSQFVAFIIFSWIAIIFSTILSYRTYHLRRDYSIIVLCLCLLLVILSMIVSNALIVLP
jgi:hypothetical protein